MAIRHLGWATRAVGDQKRLAERLRIAYMATPRRLQTEQEWREFYPVVEDFWPVEDVAEYLSALRRMADDGYRVFGHRAGEPVALAGIYGMHSVWYGDFVWLVDLVTRPERRDEGHGTALYTAIEEWARAEGYETIVLASGMDRDRTHEFYDQQGFEATEYWFEKSL